MNLIGDPWIPVMLDDGCPATMGLGELYERSTDIRDLALAPPQRIAVTRLLLCITHAALDGPEDEQDWLSCRDRIVPQSLQYLQERRGIFDLFGDQPFLQIADLEPVQNMKLDKLDVRLAAGNNTTLFDQQASSAGRTHETRWIPLQLLTFLSFAASHKITENVWAATPTGKNVEYAPCLAYCPILAIVRGQTLLESVHFNLIPKSLVTSGVWGKAVWDSVPAGAASAEADCHAKSYLGHLVPLSRAILLAADDPDITVAGGVRYTKAPIYRDPMATLIKRNDKTDWGLLRVNLQRHPWRELASILAIELRDNKQGPIMLRHLASLELDCFDLWLGGISYSTSGGYEDMVEWTFTIPRGLLDTNCLAMYTHGVELANQGESSLRNAVKEYCVKLKLDASGFRSKAIRHYWSILDTQYGRLIEIANTQSTLDPWRGILRRSMRESYAAACPHVTPRQIQAFAAGLRKLYLKKLTVEKGENDT